MAAARAFVLGFVVALVAVAVQGVTLKAPVPLLASSSERSSLRTQSAATLWARRDLGAASATQDELVAVIEKVNGTASEMRSQADLLDKVFLKTNDSAIEGHLQEAKEFARKLNHSLTAARKLSAELNASLVTIQAETGFEGLTSTFAKALLAAGQSVQELTSLEKGALAPASEDVGDYARSYKSVMYFVNKDFVGVPSTCGGKLAAEPMLGDFRRCAAACEEAVQATNATGAAVAEQVNSSCVGFQYLPVPEGSGLCLLFAELSSVTYYPGCKPAFLQRSAAYAMETQCVAKTSRLEGKTLKPDPRGQCKGCLREAKQVRGCFW